jgi:hypothetical protein
VRAADEAVIIQIRIGRRAEREQRGVDESWNSAESIASRGGPRVELEVESAVIQ